MTGKDWGELGWILIGCSMGLGLTLIAEDPPSWWTVGVIGLIGFVLLVVEAMTE